VEIYPNPANDFLHVQHNLDKLTSIEIISMDGKQELLNLKNNDESGIEINIHKLKTGMYLLRVTYNKGIITRKFIKE
jgi:hypothetical protein